MGTGSLESESGGLLRTYRYLRVLTLIPAVWLLAAILAVWATRGDVLPSISDYYGGPLRDVFVGGLMACGLAMVVYVGASKVEEYALNFAGVNAFFVALIPNSFKDLLAETRSAEAQGVDVATSSIELLHNLNLAVGSFLVVVAAFVVLDFFVVKWTQFRWSDQTRLGNVLIVGSWVLELLLLSGVIALLIGIEEVGGRSLFSGVHFAAAAFLVVNLSFAAASHAWPTQLRRPGDSPADTRNAQVGFRIITALMWAGIVLGGAAIFAKIPYSVIVTEVVEVLLFCAFWFFATRSTWKPARRKRTPAPSTQRSTPAPQGPAVTGS